MPDKEKNVKRKRKSGKDGKEEEGKKEIETVERGKKGGRRK